MLDTKEMAELCKANTFFEGGNAYERTKICCKLLLEQGNAIPSWMVIREIIGKGSANDISRGVKDFRAEHAQLLSSFNHSVPGVPDNLHEHIMGFWNIARKEAANEFEQLAINWQLSVDAAEVRAVHSEGLASLMQQELNSAHMEKAIADNKISNLENSLLSEKASREQAELMFKQSLQEYASQREQLENVLKKTSSDLSDALNRLDGERKYSMMQIEEARIKTINEVSKIQKLKEEVELSNEILKKQLMDMRIKVGVLEQQQAIYEAEKINKKEKEREIIKRGVQMRKKYNRNY